MYCKKPGLTVGSKIPAWQRCNFIYHASAHTKSDMDAPLFCNQCVGLQWGVGEGSKEQRRNTCSGGSGGDGGDSISTVVLGPQVEQIHHARAGKGRWIHSGGLREKEVKTGAVGRYAGALEEERRAKQGRKPREAEQTGTQSNQLWIPGTLNVFLRKTRNVPTRAVFCSADSGFK